MGSGQRSQSIRGINPLQFTVRNWGKKKTTTTTTTDVVSLNVFVMLDTVTAVSM